MFSESIGAVAANFCTVIVFGLFWICYNKTRVFFSKFKRISVALGNRKYIAEHESDLEMNFFMLMGVREYKKNKRRNFSKIPFFYSGGLEGCSTMCDNV